MCIRKLNNLDYEPLEAFLALHSESSMFLRSNARHGGLEYGGEVHSGEYWASFDAQGCVKGVLAHYWNGNIVTQSPDEPTLRELVDHYLHEPSHRPVAGVLGPESQAQAVLQQLGLAGLEFSCNEQEGLYSLPLESLRVPPHNPSTTHLLNITDMDRALLKGWMKSFLVEALGMEGEGAEGEAERDVERMLRHRRHWALLVEGVAVSLSGWNSYLPGMVQVGPVWTPPEHRNKGYARLVVALTLRNARNEGTQKAVLLAQNPAAIKAYLSVGFTKTGSYRIALLKKPTTLLK
eukprot:TRINITY_DN16869_c0_g1_i1.p1 TRINITY_DN16869_c0_g1~~TRINITY_DN16869_c0_g1_i1.p1  ORF type:complete len:292 (+),score=55.95 TRINITY_DN16869_c0_g1_i1:57-932(+)